MLEDLRSYRFVWRVEVLFALATFVVYMLTAFIATGDQPVTDWGDWLVATAIAGARIVAQGLLTPLARVLTALAARRQ